MTCSTFQIDTVAFGAFLSHLAAPRPELHRGKRALDDVRGFAVLPVRLGGNA